MTDENKMDREFVAALTHQVRAEAIMQWYQKYKSIHDLWLQRYTPSYDTNIQVISDCVIKFKHPPVINLVNRDGFEYVGDVNELDNFRRATLKSVYSKHRVSNREGITLWDWQYDEYGFPEIEIRGNISQRYIMTKSILTDPTALPTFRAEWDEYPVTPELLPFMQQRLFQLHTNIIVTRRADTNSDSQDSTNINPKNK